MNATTDIQRLKTFAELEGKTIAKVFVASDAVLLMTDGTTAIIHYDRGYDGDGDFEIDDRELSDHELFGVGLIDQSEYDRRIKEAERKRQEWLDREARTQYERLKARFEAT